MNISSNHNNKLLKNIKEASLELFADEYEKMLEISSQNNQSFD